MSSEKTEVGASNLKCTLLVLKVASRCNLNCSYCYVYNLGDTTYKEQPRVMSPSVVTAVLGRVKTHCARHGLSRFVFIFHGGEPLLAEKEFYRRFVKEARERLLPEVSPMFALQTNGTLLTDDWCDLFGSLDIHIGISLDGPSEVNDRFRVDHAGNGSYERARRGIDTAVRSRALRMPPGLLTVINVQSDPVEVYEHFKSLGLTTIDFLLPEATHDRPPAGSGELGLQTPYADWLIAVFDRWFHESPVRVSVRLFETIVTLILGGEFNLDSIGANRNEVLVIEADGGIEPVGSLKICGHGFTKVGANVLHDEIDAAIATDLVTLFNLGGERLCETCARCPVGGVCGGGYLPHRYRAINGFDNPSVYCHDLMKLITHIQNKVLDELPSGAKDKIGLTPLRYEDAQRMAYNVQLT